MYKVLITDKINTVAGEILTGVATVDFLPTLPEDELIEKIGEYDALMIRSQTKVTPKILDACKKMKIIARAGVGVDNIDIEKATQKGIIVVNSPDGNTTAAAEHTLAMMMSMARHIPEACASTKQGEWKRSKLTGIELFNKTLGIIGLGKIGARVAKVALSLGMKVVVYDPFSSQEMVEKMGASYLKSLDEFWKSCDFISIHAPKTRETANLINKETLSKMRKGVRIINCARGGIVNEADLKDAVEAGHVAAIAFDVFETEPIKSDSPLLGCKGDVILTPHLGASTTEAQLNVAVDVAEQIRDFLMGKNIKNAVNIPFLKAEILEPVKDYMGLAENLGLFLAQLIQYTPNKLKITTTGELAKLDISPLRASVLKGFLSFNLEGVNYVNSPFIAKERGISIAEEKIDSVSNYLGTIGIEASENGTMHRISGALVAKNMPRVVKIDSFNTNITPNDNILMTFHEDKPGIVATIASVLAKENINISAMQVDNKPDSNDAMMALNINKPIDDSTLEEIKQSSGIKNAVYVSLKA